MTADPLDDDLLNIAEGRAENLAEDLELDLSRSDREDLSGYTAERAVDDIDDDELERNGGLYTVRTTVKWGGDHFGGKKESLSVVKLWWKGTSGGGSGGKSSNAESATK